MTTSILRALPLLLALGSAPALAAESIGVVAVADPPGPGAELAELTHQLRLVLAERASGVVEARALRERMLGQTSSATLAELDRAYAGALATYQGGDFEGAVRTLRAVVGDLERLPPSAAAFAQWTRAMLRLARSEQTLGRATKARDLLERLVRASPTVKVDTTQYPPSFARQVQAVKAEVAALATRRLAVTANAKGAKVFVEGREVGVAPLTLDLPPGRYRVAGSVGKLHVPAVSADLTEEGQAIALNFALAEALRPSSGPGLALAEPSRARDLVAAGAWLGVDRLLAAGFVTEEGVEYLTGAMYDVRRGMLQREGRVRLTQRVAPAGSLSALATFLVTGQSSALVAQTAPEPAREARPSLAVKPPPQAAPALDFEAPAARPRRSGALGWTAFGAAVLGTGLGAFAIYEGLSARSSYDDASALLQSDGALRADASVAGYRRYVDDGDSAKDLAYASAGAAAGCFVVSGVLGYLSYRQTGEIGPFRF